MFIRAIIAYICIFCIFNIYTHIVHFIFLADGGFVFNQRELKTKTLNTDLISGLRLDTSRF